MAAADMLPRIDEHSAVIEAEAGDTWEALLRVVESSVSSAGATRFARLLGLLGAIKRRAEKEA
jgi:hypothetical protein